VSKRTVIINMICGKIENKQPLIELFKGLKDGRYMVELATAKKRSNAQNRYWWALVVPMVKKGIEEMYGEKITNEEAHEFLKARFNAVQLVNKQTGEVEMLPRSTSRLTTVQFNELIEQVQRFGAEFLGIDIPSPNEQMQIAF
jgi:hypothetical protein